MARIACFPDTCFWMATVRKGNEIQYGRVLAASATEASARAAIAGEVLGVERMP
jgi:hypothetical protein